MVDRHFQTENGSYLLHIDEGASCSRTTIFLHGPGFSSAAEQSIFAPHLSGAGRHIWFDQLGCGESSVLAPDRMSWDACVDDVAAIAEEFGDGPIRFIGHSAGVKVIDDLVRRYRSLVAAAVWISPANVFSDAFKTIVSRSVAEGRLDPNSFTSEQQRQFDDCVSTSEEDFGPDQVLSFLELASMIRDVHELYWSDPVTMQAHMLATEGVFVAPEAFLKLSSDYFSRGEMPPPNYEGIPTLIIYSPDDDVTEWEQHGAAAARALPHAEVCKVEGGAHFVHLQKPRETAREISRFLAANMPI
ncbi:MAG: alpha/beta hydrolase [Acidobacteria bacterium]|nr:alpha/beta hydrolase [Acidobacteriota bacterium]